MQNDAFAEANTGELSGASTTIQNFVNASLIRKPPKFAAVTPAGAYTEEIPQRPVRIGRGGKYYELMYVDGVAREIPVQQRKQQDQPFPSRFQEPRAEADGLSTALVGQVLEIQDLHNSELQPQPSARRRRSRQGPLAAQPTPPIRRHRPGSLRSKESTPSRESPDVSISEDSTKETPKAQPPLGIVLEYDSQDTEALYHSVPPPVPVQEANLTRSIAAPKVPFYNLTCRAQPPENVKEFKNAVPSAEFLLAKTVTDEKRSKSPSPHRVPLPEDTLSQAVSAVQNTASPMSDRITSTELPSSAVEQVVPNSQLEDMSRPTQEINPSLTMQKRSPHLPMRTPPQCKPEPRFFVKNACLSVTEPVHSVQCEEAAQTHQEAFTAVTLTPAATTAFQLELQQSSSRQPSPQVLHGRMPHLDRQPSPRLNTVESCTHEQHRQPPSTSTSNSGTNDTSRDSLRTASLAAPIVHREVLDEPSLGTTSPESLKDWYDEEENPYDEDNEDEPIKRKPSKIIRRLQGLFERKRPDDPSANVTGERKRLDQLDAPPPSPREPTTPTKKSKLGQFFSFSKKDNKGKHSPPPELFCPAVQGPEIPDGMLAKVFMSRLTEEKQAERTRTQSCAPPVINFRDWSPSSEDLTVFDRQKPAKPKSPPKSSRFYVPEIPPFQSKPASAKSKVPSGKHSSDSTGDMLSPPDCTGEAQNSPYSGCRDRANANILGPRRTSLASDDVAALYDEFYDREKRSVLCEEATKSGFTRKLSTKAAAIPAELRAPLYRPPASEGPSQKKMFQAQVKEESKSSPPGSQLEAPQPPPPSTSPQTSIPQTETPSSGNVSDAEEPHHREAADGEFDRLSPERCNVVRELRLVFRNARQLIQLMLQDLLYGVPKEVWSELRIVLVILTVMLLGLYIRGMVRFNGTSFSDLLRAVFRGLRVLLGMVLHGGMTLYDTMDAMLSDASTNLVADTLREI